MNDKETHVLINTEQRCVKSSLQWKRADGKQACEVLGARQKAQSDTANFKQVEETVPE